MISNLWQENGIYITGLLKFNLYDNNGAYILLRDKIIIIESNATTQVAFKDCARFINYIAKTDRSTRNGAKDLDLVILMYNLLEYNSNYSDRTGSLCFYSKY